MVLAMASVAVAWVLSAAARLVKRMIGSAARLPRLGKVAEVAIDAFEIHSDCRPAGENQLHLGRPLGLRFALNGEKRQNLIRSDAIQAFRFDAETAVEMNTGADPLMTLARLGVIALCDRLSLPAIAVEHDREPVLSRTVGHIALTCNGILQAGRNDREVFDVLGGKPQGLD